MWLYLNGAYVEHGRAAISPFDRGFLFSDGVYEVIRYYPQGGFFKTEEHLQRLRYGLGELRIQGIDTAVIKPVIDELMDRNEQRNGQATAYIQVTRGASIPRQHFFPPASTPPTLLISTSPFKPHTEEIEHGVGVLLEKDIRWSRCDIKTIALLPNVLSRQKAVEAGACETIWSRDSAITEGTHTNFCAVTDGKLLMPPPSSFILAGVTRGVILGICRESGIPVSEAQIRDSELREFDECMIIGTTTEVTPVVMVNETTIRDGAPGLITRRLQQALQEKIAGRR
jgi:D-alanine transaminase